METSFDVFMSGIGYNLPNDINEKNLSILIG